MQDESPEGNPQPSLPAAIVNVSAQAATGLEELQAALGPLLGRHDARDSIDESSAAEDEEWG